MRTWIVGLLLGIFVALAIGKTNIVHVTGRSGDVIIEPKTATELKNELYLYYSNAEQKTEGKHSIKETDVADLLSFVVGGPVASPEAKRSQFPSLTPFKKAKANLFLSFPGITSDLLKIQHMTSLKRNEIHSVYDLSSSYPEDAVAHLTSMFTGKTVTDHEIVARTWNTPHYGKTVAYRAYAVPQTPSIGAQLSAAYEGKSLIISASGDFSLASSTSAYPLDHHSSTHFTYFYNPETKQVENVYDGSVLFTREEAMERAFARKFALKPSDQTRAIANRNELVVNIADTQHVLNDNINGDSIKAIFNFLNKEDSQMFIEFEIAFAVLEQLKSNPATKDKIQDMYSFVFSGVKAVSAKYGVGTSQHFAALYLADAVIKQLFEEFSALYNNELVMEVHLPQLITFDQTSRDEIFQLVKGLVSSKELFNEYFPHIYAKEDSLVDSLCNTLKSKVTKYSVSCFERDAKVFAEYKKRFEQEVQDVNQDIQISQIVLWFSIVLVIAVIVVVYSVVNMDTKMENLLMKGGLKPHNN